MSEWVIVLSISVGGWVLYVERRLAEVVAIKEVLHQMDAKVERLIDHIIGKT